MNMLFDKNIYAQTSWDSATPNGLTALAHQFTTVGEHQVTLQKGGQVVRTFPIQVKRNPRKAAPAAAEAAAVPPKQLNIDLVGPESPEKELVQRKLGERFSTAPEGYVLFQARSDLEGYSVVSRMMAGGKQKETFNSEKLTNGDYYTVTLVRPGKYTMTNVLTGAKGTLTMAYPVVGDKPYQPPEPVRIKCTAGGLEPAQVSLQPLQTVVFEFQVPSRVKIDLVEPTERPITKA